MTGAAARALEALAAAQSGAAVLAEVAGWFGGPAPTPEELAGDWWGELPGPVQLEVSERLRRLSVGVVSAGLPEPPTDKPPGYGGALFVWWEWLWSGTPGKRATPDVAAHVLTRAWLALLEADPDGCPRHPLAPLVEAWQERATEAATVDGDRDPALLPAEVVTRSKTGAWKRFALPAHTRPDNPQMVLPGLDGGRDPQTPDIPLDLWEGLGEVGSRSGTLTPATRLFLATLMAGDMADRHGRRFIRKPVAWWWGWMHPDPDNANTARLWSQFRDGLARIERLPRVPFWYSDGSGEAVRLVSVIGTPPRNNRRDWLSLQVNYPPNANTYAVSLPWRRILQHGVTWQQARAAILLMRLSFRWAEPNHGLLPVTERGRRKRWIPDRNPDKYRPIGDPEAAALVARGTGRQHRPGVAAADLARLAGAGDVLLYGAGGQPIAWKGKADRNNRPLPDPKMVATVRREIAAGRLKVLPAPTDSIG